MTYCDNLKQKRENFALLLTDAARYKSLAGKTLKELYTFLMSVTCDAHLLHNCSMRVRAYFKNIDEVVATIKAATNINKDRKNDFHEAGLPSPPDLVITRWATWLRAAFLLFVPLSTIGQVEASQSAEQKALLMRMIWCMT